MGHQEKILELIQRLEKLIKETIENTPELSEIIEEIREEGIQVSLNFIAMFADKDGSPIVAQQLTEMDEESELEFKITDSDREFLKGIGISFD